MKFQPVAVLVAVLLFALSVQAQTTAFTYQGQLNSNSVPANGLYDFRFRLFDVSSNAVAGPITNAPVGVTNGLFTATLDFGSAVFDGSDRWLEVAVRSNSSVVAYTKLSPLQPITSTPYAIQSLNASSAITLSVPLQGSNVVGTIRATNLPPNVAFLTSNQLFTASNNFAGVVMATNAANSFSGTFNGTFAGNGSGLTGLTATNLTGTIADARLSTNVALQSNPALVFAGNVTASNFTGAGHGLTNVPGAFFWVIPTNGLMFPNVGYICTNDFTNVVMTLPASPAIGDTFKICGDGNGGWIIAQNTNQTIFSSGLVSISGQSWRQDFGLGNWAGVACSADGTRIVAPYNGDKLYVSTDSGANWTARDSARNWSSVASSADGMKMAATVGWSDYNTLGTGQVYISGDGGTTWAQPGNAGSLGNLQWACCAVSGNGTRLAAGVRAGLIYTNNGANWNPSTGSPTGLWTSIAASFDGTKMAITDANRAIYTSTTGGATWVLRTNFVSGTWSFTSVASSSDGTRLAAATTDGQIFMSVDAGVTWYKATTLATTSTDWASIASSSDGSKYVVAFGGNFSGNVYASTDSGSTWSLLNAAPAATWAGIASSADGAFFAGAVHGTYVYISAQRTTTGTNGFLMGSQHSAMELIYTGNGNFLPLNHEGNIRAY